MREVIGARLKEFPVHVQRNEVEAMGEEVGLEGVEAARLFDRLKGVERTITVQNRPAHRFRGAVTA